MCNVGWIQSLNTDWLCARTFSPTVVMHVCRIRCARYSMRYTWNQCCVLLINQRSTQHGTLLPISWSRVPITHTLHFLHFTSKRKDFGVLRKPSLPYSTQSEYTNNVVRPGASWIRQKLTANVLDAPQYDSRRLQRYNFPFIQCKE